MDRTKIGNRLRELRGTRSQAEIAKDLGVTAMAISSYESGKRIPNDNMKVKLAEYYGANVTSIFFAD